MSKLVSSFKIIAVICTGIILFKGSAIALPVVNISSSTMSEASLGSNGEFQTTNANGQFAAQSFDLDFTGDLGSLNDISGAFYKLDNVLLTGNAFNANGKLIQNTTGGTINIYSDSALSDLLLSANLQSGSIMGEGSDVWFSAWTFEASAGRLLQETSAREFDIILDYTIPDVVTGGCVVFSKRCFLASTPPKTTVPGNIASTNGRLDAFDAILNSGRIDGKVVSGPPTQPIPEPTSMLLLGSGLLGLARTRKKISK